MRLGRATRRFALAVHVTASVAWFGAVLCFLVLSIVGLRGETTVEVNSAYAGMSLVGWYVIVPLGALSLFGGLLQGWGTEWGVTRHYWILVKLALTVVSYALLLLHMQPTTALGEWASRGAALPLSFHDARVQLMVDAAAALAVLGSAIALSIYKPEGVTRRRRPVADQTALPV